MRTRSGTMLWSMICCAYVEWHLKFCTVPRVYSWLYIYAILQEEDLYQEAEPLVTGGIAAALQLASKKGFISNEKPKREAGESMRTATDAKRDLWVHPNCNTIWYRGMWSKFDIHPGIEFVDNILLQCTTVFIGVGTCIRLEGPKDSSTRSACDFLTTPTFPSNHAHFRINEAVW